MPETSGQFGIGEVLAQLRPEFPDISTSKIRFLEAEGLIEPARSQSGYRRFSTTDIERLRYILTMQRDSYLPLRVIRERLADGDTEPGAGGHPAGQAPADMTRRQLLDAAEISEAELTELEDYGLIRRVGRQYGGDALAVARAVVALRPYGVQARHLRAVKAAADREANLVEQVVAPQLRQRGAGARDAAARTAWQIADLTLQLHATLVESALAEAGLASAPLHARVLDLERLNPAAVAGSGPAQDATRHATLPASGPAAGGLRSASGRLRVYLGKGSGGQQRFPRHVRTEL
jgi:DNA-binding transcriptional MerR regulator